MKVLVIGSGGREHALAWKISQSRKVSKVFCAPGNPGIGALAQLVPLPVTDLQGLLEFARREKIGLTVVGPEGPLAEGIVDLFVQHDLPVFGPARNAAELEWSKVFAKAFMERHGIPTAAFRSFAAGQRNDALAYLRDCPIPVVVKADGLAAGKGVLVCETREQALAGITEMFEHRAFGAAGERVVVEEYLEGEEASVFALTDGERFVTLAPAQDHKRVFDGDRGKNTGGMGAYSPTPIVNEDSLAFVGRTIIAPTLSGMKQEGRLYRGCLYVGLMFTKDGPKVVEYNCRFGDPETQVVLPLYSGDIVEVLLACAAGNLPAGSAPAPRGRRPMHAVCVVLASRGYPDPYPSGMAISGVKDAEELPGIVVFHSGTKEVREKLVTAGGRVLGVTAICQGETLADAIAASYAAVERISFEGMHFRRDIGRKALVS